MSNLSLGTIEVLGLPAAVEAADVALKTANVQLIGYETTDGMGMVAVKIEGQVSAVQSAVAAARAAAEKITKVFAVSVIARPSDQLSPVVLTELTVGLEKPPAEPVENPVSAGPTSEPPSDAGTPAAPQAPGPDASAKPADVPADQADVPVEPADAPSGPPVQATPTAATPTPARGRGRKAPAAP